MHLSRVNYFQKKYPLENCISGILTTCVDDFSVGTPLIAQVKPFSKQDGPKSPIKGDPGPISRSMTLEKSPKVQNRTTGQKLRH